MPKAVLPEFQGYLLARQLVPEKNVSYYAWWASKFLTYSNNHEDLSLPLRLEKFIDHLGHQKQLEDWQLHQAREAVRLSAYAEYHGLCPWMNAYSVSKTSSAYGFMLRRISLLADNPPKPWF